MFGMTTSNSTALASPSDLPIKMTLDQGIEELCRYGRPHMMQHNDKKWSCSVDMQITSGGASFNVASGYGNITILEAVGKCVNNMHGALRDMGVDPNAKG